MFNKVDTMHHLSKKIPNFLKAANALSSDINPTLLIVAAMYSSDETFNFLVDTGGIRPIISLLNSISLHNYEKI